MESTKKSDFTKLQEIPHFATPLPGSQKPMEFASFVCFGAGALRNTENNELH